MIVTTAVQRSQRIDIRLLRYGYSCAWGQTQNSPQKCKHTAATHPIEICLRIPCMCAHVVSPVCQAPDALAYVLFHQTFEQVYRRRFHVIGTCENSLHYLCMRTRKLDQYEELLQKSARACVDLSTRQTAPTAMTPPSRTESASVDLSAARLLEHVPSDMLRSLRRGSETAFCPLASHKW